MFKLETSLSAKDGSYLYSNEHNVLEIMSVHRIFPSFFMDDDIRYSESVFSTTGKDKWQNLVDDYNYRCYVSEHFGDVVTSYVDRKPYGYLRETAFSLTVGAIKQILKDK